MPITNTIDREEKIIHTVCSGIMRQEDFSDYINRIWRTNEHYEYNELFDTTHGDWSEFDFGYLFAVAKEASTLEGINPESKLAWVVEEGKQKALTDFYKAVKSTITDRSRSLEAFYTAEEAMSWLKQ